MTVAARAGRGAGVLLTMAALTACTSGQPGDNKPSPRPSLTTPSLSPSPADAGAAAVKDATTAYRGMWDAFTTASNNGETAPPTLSKFVAGDALKKLNGGLALNKSRQVTSKGAPKIAPRITSVGPVAAPTSVSIGDCLDDSNWLLYKANGQPVDNVPGGRRKVTAKVDKVGSEWKVTTFAMLGVGTCN